MQLHMVGGTLDSLRSSCCCSCCCCCDAFSQQQTKWRQQEELKQSKQDSSSGSSKQGPWTVAIDLFGLLLQHELGVACFSDPV